LGSVDTGTCFANIRAVQNFLLICCLLTGARAKETTLLTPPFSHTLGFSRASKFYLDMYTKRNFRFADPEGLACEKLRAEDDTTTVMDDHILSLFGVNSGTGEIVYNTGMRNLRIFGKAGSGDGEFQHPHGIAVHRNGDVYVADTDNNRVVHLRYTRNGLEFGGNISGFSHPCDVAVDSRGRVYVADCDNSRVVVLDAAGQVKANWDGFNRPTGICVIDRDARRNYYEDDFAVVIDDNGRRLTKVNLSGEQQAAISARDIGLASAGFAYCALDYYASVYVTDRLNDQVHKFDHNLVHITSFGRTGSGEGEFNSPRGIAIGRQFGQVFIGEAEGGQYYWIGLDAYFLGCFPPVIARDRPGTTIALYATEVSELTISILDKKKKRVRSLYTPKNREKPGELLVVWDGRDDAGKPVPPGDYTVQAVLKPTYGGFRGRFQKELTGKVKRV